MGLSQSGWGHLGRDVEVAYSQGGFAFGKTAVACKIPKKNQDGSYGATEWVELTFLGAQAENAAKYLKKGSKMWFSGYPQTEEYTDKQGNKRKTTRVVIQQWESLESRQDNVDGHGQQGQQGFGQQQPQGQQGFGQQQPQGQPYFGQQQPQHPQGQGGFNPNNPGQPQFGQQQTPGYNPNAASPVQPGTGQGFGQNMGFPNQQTPPNPTGGGFNPNGEDVPF